MDIYYEQLKVMSIRNEMVRVYSRMIACMVALTAVTGIWKCRICSVAQWSGCLLRFFCWSSMTSVIRNQWSWPSSWQPIPI